MNVAIIGAGSVGKALARSLSRCGHSVTVGSRLETREKHRAELREQSIDCPVTSNREAVGGAEIVVLSVPWHEIKAAIDDCGSLASKVVIDCSNPLRSDRRGLELGFETSGAEQTARWAAGAAVCKTFNHAGAEAQADPSRYPTRPVMFVCGDDPEAKRKVLSLVGSIGFEAVDAGALEAARLLEPLAMLWVHLSQHMGLGRDFAYGLLRPSN